MPADTRGRVSLLSQRESQGAGNPPPTVDDQRSHESGEPIGVTIRTIIQARIARGGTPPPLMQGEACANLPLFGKLKSPTALGGWGFVSDREMDSGVTALFHPFG